MIYVVPGLTLDERELEFRFVRARGPGGQNVNKVSSAVELRFDARHSSSLPTEMMERLERLAGARMTQEGVIVIQADTHRTQTANRRDAVARLTDLLRAAAHRPRPRKPTKATAGSKRRRLESKHRRSTVKDLRRTPNERS
ncbi:MAG: alternative ribosome rescue aminoacyl-tRNA hydrolase ArfB [Gemmatimonas sp.]